MTTESKQVIRSRSGYTLLGAAISALLAGLVVVLIGALAQGPHAAYGALVGTALCVAVFGFGAFVVNVVAGVMPAAALLIAMLTYTMQVALMALAFLALTRSGVLDETLDRRWLGGAVITATMSWLVAQIWLSTRARIVAYDLPGGQSEAGAR
jgi:hypothetical protein